MVCLINFGARSYFRGRWVNDFLIYEMMFVVRTTVVVEGTIEVIDSREKRGYEASSEFLFYIDLIIFTSACEFYTRQLSFRFCQLRNTSLPTIDSKYKLASPIIQGIQSKSRLYNFSISRRVKYLKQLAGCWRATYLNGRSHQIIAFWIEIMTKKCSVCLLAPVLQNKHDVH